MPATPYQQNTLAMDANWLRRFSQLLLSQAGVVAQEVNTTPNHANRVALANRIINSPQQTAASLSPAVCGMTNLVVSNITFDFTLNATVTDATDTAISNQLQTSWNVLAGQ